MTHRDPTDVILSVAELYADIIGSFTDETDRREIGRLNIEHWALGMDWAMQFRAGGADDRFYDTSTSGRCRSIPSDRSRVSTLG